MLYVSKEEFNHLRSGQKYFLVEQYGTYLDASYHSGKYLIALFWLPCRLSGYYVSVKLHRDTDNISGCTAFTDYKMLDPFLTDVDVEPLYALL